MAGMNYEKGSFKWVEPSGNDLLSETLNDLALSVGAKNVKAWRNEYALLGYFGRLSYDYLGKYIAEVNMRYDGTSRFKSSDRWGFFPSMALGWRISEEQFFTSLKPTISNLKLRFSVGSLGNQVTDGYTNPYYPYIRTISLENTTKFNYIFDNAQTVYAKIGAPVSGSLTWETVVTKNVGLDIGLLNHRLGLTLDV